MGRFSDDLARRLVPVGLHSQRDETVWPVPPQQERAEAERLTQIIDGMLRFDPSLLIDLGWAEVIIPVEVRRRVNIGFRAASGEGQLGLYLPPGFRP